MIWLLVTEDSVDRRDTVIPHRFRRFHMLSLDERRTVEQRVRHCESEELRFGSRNERANDTAEVIVNRVIEGLPRLSSFVRERQPSERSRLFDRCTDANAEQVEFILRKVRTEWKAGPGTQITFTVTVPQDLAPPHVYDVTVTNPDGGAATSAGSFTVT